MIGSHRIISKLSMWIDSMMFRELKVKVLLGIWNQKINIWKKRLDILKEKI